MIDIYSLWCQTSWNFFTVDNDKQTKESFVRLLYTWKSCDCRQTERNTTSFCRRKNLFTLSFSHVRTERKALLSLLSNYFVYLGLFLLRSLSFLYFELCLVLFICVSSIQNHIYSIYCCLCLPYTLYLFFLFSYRSYLTSSDLLFYSPFSPFEYDFLSLSLSLLLLWLNSPLALYLPALLSE